MSRVIIVGAFGWLGLRIGGFLERTGIEVYPLAERITSFSHACAAAETPGDVVLNCAGVTGRPHIDWCEAHQEETRFGNVRVPYWLAMACKRVGKPLLHLSSGCIFEGVGPRGTGWEPGDEPNFLRSYYSRTKWDGERAVLDVGCRATILRLRMPFDGVPHERNLLTKLAKYRQVVEGWESMTSVRYLSSVVRQVVLAAGTEYKVARILHVVCAGLSSPVEIVAAMRRAGISVKFKRALTLAELDAQVVAPRSHCVLAPSDVGIGVPEVQAELSEAIKQYEEKVRQEQ